MKRLPILVLLALLSNQLAAQEFHYLHYTPANGLPGSTIYDMCQDNDGFIWFATESGLSRYDGTNFKTFTVKDGLPDNEILKIFADSKGRVWIGSFSKELCYYHNGKFYSKANDSLLKEIKPVSNISSFAEASDGTIALSDYSNVITISPGNRVKVYRQPGAFVNVTSWYSNGRYRIIASYSNKKNFLLDPAQNNFLPVELEAYSPAFDWMLRDKKLLTSRLNDNGDVVKTIPFKPSTTAVYNDKNVTLFVLTDDGAWSVDTVNNKYDVHYLPGKKVNKVLIDKENGLWFSTFNNGVYKLSSQSIKNIIPVAANKEIFCLTKHGSDIICGISNSNFFSIGRDNKITYSDYQAGLKHTLNPDQRNRLYCAKALTSGATILGFDACLVELKNKVPRFIYTFHSIKSIDEIDDRHILVGTSHGAYKIDTRTFQVTDTIWKGRTTKVLYQSGYYFTGTIKGLYRTDSSGKNEYLGDIHPSLSRRITDMKAAPGGTLWVATSDQGIIALKNNKVVAVLKDSNKINSNICKTLFLNGTDLWVGTDKGLNKIDISSPLILPFLTALQTGCRAISSMPFTSKTTRFM